MESLDSLFAEISAPALTGEWLKPAIPATRMITDLKEEEVTEFTIRKAGELVETGMHAIQDLKDVIVTGQNPDEIAALSELMNATTRTLEALSKFALLQKKVAMSKEATTAPTTQIQNNVIVASREEIMKQIIQCEQENKTTVPQIPSHSQLSLPDNDRMVLDEVSKAVPQSVPELVENPFPQTANFVESRGEIQLNHKI